MDDCPFCNREMFKERIIAETNNFYIVATLGQITDGGHVLIVSKEHLRCVGDMPHELLGDFSFWVDFTSKVLSFEYGVRPLDITVFEHGITGQTVPHAHVHIVPARMDFTLNVRKDFPTTKLWTYHAWEEVAHYFRKKEEHYLLRKRSPATFDVLWDNSAPDMYLRTVLAKTLGVPERANWKGVDPVLDKQLWVKTVQLLKPHFEHFKK